MFSEAVLHRNRYVVSEVPLDWGRGTFTGNGLLGTMAHRDDHYPVFWEIGRTDVMDRSKSEMEGKGKFKNNDIPHYRVPIGKLLLMPWGAVREGGLELDLWDAEERGFIRTDEGTLRWRTLTHTRMEVIAIDLEVTDGAMAMPAVGFRPGYSMPLSFPYGVMVDYYTLNPPPVLVRKGAIHGCLQHTRVSDDYATAYTIVDVGPSHQRIYLTVQKAPTDQEAWARAQAVLKEATAAAFESLLDEHREWWHGYWSLGGVELPDARLERYYCLQFYKFACATRADRPAYDMLGPWPYRTVWAAMWWNFNVQSTYLPLYAGNRLDIARSLLQMVDGHHDNLRRNGAAFGSDVMQVGRATDRDCLGVWEGEWCNLPWVCFDYFQHYRHSMDESLLPRLYPLLRESINLYLHLLQKGPDGRLHLPEGVSPEYERTDRTGASRFTAPDTHINLALLRWGCQTLLWLNDRLGRHDPLRDRWQQVLQDLTPYPEDENGWMIGAGAPFDHSHRHFSHLMAFYPLGLARWSDPHDRAVIERSVRHWLRLDEKMAGWSWPAAAAIVARMGSGDEALALLNRYLDGDMAQPNSMDLEHPHWGSPDVAPALVASAVQDMLLQNEGDVLRVFPAIPKNWTDVRVDKLRIAGAFLVSAQRIGGQTRRVTITAEIGGSLALSSPWSGPTRCSAPQAVRDSERGLVRVELMAGQTVELRPADEGP